MLEELEHRNHAPSTHLRTVEHYAGYFHRPPDRLGTDHIRQYQAAMFRSWKLAPKMVSSICSVVLPIRIKASQSGGVERFR